jgi:glycosyltransferase involved in cell wall biosynthesis
VHGLDANLVLIGDGPLKARLARLVDELGMTHQVTFCSAVPHAQIQRYYRDADIFAIATHYEGFCIPVLEAMAAGLPVVASRIPPIEEIMGDTGFLVENQPAAFASALRRLVDDAALREAEGARAARRAGTMSGQVMERRERDLYAALCP